MIAPFISDSRPSISCRAFLRASLPDISWRHSWKNLSSIEFWRVIWSLPKYSATCCIPCWQSVIAFLRSVKGIISPGSFEVFRRSMTSVVFFTTRESFSILLASSPHPIRLLDTTWNWLRMTYLHAALWCSSRNHGWFWMTLITISKNQSCGISGIRRARVDNSSTAAASSAMMIWSASDSSFGGWNYRSSCLEDGQGIVHTGERRVELLQWSQGLAATWRNTNWCTDAAMQGWFPWRWVPTCCIGIGWEVWELLCEQLQVNCGRRDLNMYVWGAAAWWMEHLLQ